MYIPPDVTVTMYGRWDFGTFFFPFAVPVFSNFSIMKLYKSYENYKLLAFVH